jgi:hypothetical protein
MVGCFAKYAKPGQLESLQANRRFGERHLLCCDYA